MGVSGRRSHRDGGSLHVLEVVIVVTMMAGTAAWYVTLERPSPVSEITTDELKTKLNDHVNIAEDTPINSPCDGATEFDKRINLAVSGNNSALWSRLNATFGDAILENVIFNNRQASMDLVHSFDNPGTGLTTTFYPNHTYSKILLQREGYSGAERLVADVPAIDSWTSLKAQGEAVKTTIIVDGALTNPEISTTSLTAMLGAYSSDWKTRTIAQNLTWALLSGAPLLTRDLRAEQLGFEMSFHFRVDPGLSGIALDQWTLPAKLKATVRIPAGWGFDLADTATKNPAWTVTATGSSVVGWDVLLKLNANVTSSNLVELRLTPPSAPVRSYDTLHARLGRGSLSESTLVVQYPVSVEAGLSRAAYATTPYPVRHGERAIFGVAFANGADAVTVPRVRVELPGNYGFDGPGRDRNGVAAALFADAPVELLDGSTDGVWTWIDARTLEWTPVGAPREVAASSATSWVFSVKITTDIAQHTSVEEDFSSGPISTLTFPNGYVSKSTRWGPTPGTIRHEVSPASNNGAGNDGYPWALTNPQTYEIHGSVTAFRRNIQSNTTYVIRAEAADVATQTQNGIANSTFTVVDRAPRLGGIVRANADISSLASQLDNSGATDARFTIDLFSPNTYGCTPILSVTRQFGSLPLSAIRAVELWDSTGLGAPGIYVTGDDKRAYQLDSFGRVVWSRQLQAEGLSMEAASFGVGDQGLIVGVANGQLERFSPTTGNRAWSIWVDRAVWSTSKVPNGVTTIAVNEAAGRIIAATSQGGLELRTDAGVFVGRQESSRQDSFKQVAFGPDGQIYAMSTKTFYQYDPELVQSGFVKSNGAVGFAIAPIGIILNEGTTTRIYDPATLSLATGAPDPIIHTSAAILATAGDATGDGVTDLVLALEDLDVVVIDGISGNVAWTYHPALGTPRGVFTLETLTVQSQENTCDLVVNNDPNTRHSSQAQCTQALGATANKPLALYADGGKVAYARKENGITRLTLTGGEIPSWTQALPMGSKPLVTTIGPWLPNDGVLTGTENGTLILHDTATGEALMDTQVSSFAGKFAYQLRVPPGALFGTHLLVGTLSWNDGSGAPHVARLFDTFEVVGMDGNPAVLPSYLISFILEQRDDPYIVRNG